MIRTCPIWTSRHRDLPLQRAEGDSGRDLRSRLSHPRQGPEPLRSRGVAADGVVPAPGPRTHLTRRRVKPRAEAPTASEPHSAAGASTASEFCHVFLEIGSRRSRTWLAKAASSLPPGPGLHRRYAAQDRPRVVAAAALFPQLVDVSCCGLMPKSPRSWAWISRTFAFSAGAQGSLTRVRVRVVLRVAPQRFPSARSGRSGPAGGAWWR